jgi:hypothetical protein
MLNSHEGRRWFANTTEPIRHATHVLVYREPGGAMKLSILFPGLIWAAMLAVPAPASEQNVFVAAAPQAADSSAGSEDMKELSPEQKMSRRFPQPIRVGALLGLPVLDWRDSTIGFITQVVRTPAGKIELIVPYRSWLGWLPSGRLFDWGRRPVAVPLETVAILARQVAALDMSREQFDAASSFAASHAAPLGADETIQIAITRR